MNRTFTIPPALALLAALAACGGGGGAAGAPATPPAAATPVFNACYNPALYVVGAYVNVSYRSPAGDTRIDNSSTVLANQVFNGVTGLNGTNYTSNTFTGNGAFFSTNSGTSFAGLPNAATGIRNYGVVTVQPTGSQTLYSPAWDDPTFILTPGQSTTFSFTGIQSNSGVSAGTFTTSRTLTFVATEDVTTPAGIFKAACHIRTADSTTATGNSKTNSTTDDWYAATTGVLIQESFGGAISYNLVSGTVNGKTLP